MKRTLIFFEIGRYNFLLCYICSFFYDIKTYRFQNSRIRNLLKNATLIEYEEIVDRDEILVLKSGVVKKWQQTAEKLKNPDYFTYRLDGLTFSFNDKAWKDFGVVFEQHELVRTIKEKFQYHHWVIMSHSDIYLLGKYYSYTPEKMPTFVLRIINFCNVFKGAIKFQAYRYAAMLSQTAYILKMLFFHNPKKITAKIVWSAISPHELAMPIETSQAIWLLNNTDINKNEILYMHPVKTIFLKEPSQLDINYFYSIFQIIATLQFKDRLSVSLFALKNLFKSIFYLLSFSEKINILYREQELNCWLKAINILELKTMVNSVSESLHSNHQVLLFNKLNLKTVFYLYSANSFFITSFDRHILKHLSYSKMLNNTFVVWHQKYKEMLINDYHIKADIHVIGPLMSHKEHLATKDTPKLRETFLPSSESSKTYISIYDVSPQMKNINQGLTSYFPAIYNEEFCTKFHIDIERLMNEVDDLVFIYKPKRNNKNKKFPLPDALVEILERNEKNPNWINLSNSVNPWVPIMAADINIGMPFTSTCFAALCKNKEFLFHNPDHLAKYHEFEDIESHISNSYAELKEKVLLLKSGKKLKDLSQSKYYVKEPARGFSQAFADLLRSISH